jgi:hypothetical protein
MIRSTRNGEPIDTRELSLDEAAALPIARKASNLALAFGRVAKAAATGEKIIVSPAEMERRLAICRVCEFFQASPMKCLKCDCFLNLKTRLETEHCPIAKW